MSRLIDQKLLVETQGIYESPGMQAFILQEVQRPCKQWVVDVINGAREASEVRLRTDEFVLLPDTERTNRYGKGVDWECVKRAPRFLVGCRKCVWAVQRNHTRQWGQAYVPRTWRLCQSHPQELWGSEPETGWRSDQVLNLGAPETDWRENANPKQYRPRDANTPSRQLGKHVNWLAIATEPGLRSLRDLRGRHLPMLRRMLLLSKSRIQAETGVHPEEIMAYIHYPPSVYQLHVHLAYPYAQYNQRDVFRIHGLETVINNLEMDPEYYAKAALQVSLGRNSALYQICSGGATQTHTHVGAPRRRKSI